FESIYLPSFIFNPNSSKKDIPFNSFSLYGGPAGAITPIVSPFFNRFGYSIQHLLSLAPESNYTERKSTKQLSRSLCISHGLKSIYCNTNVKMSGPFKPF